MATTMPYITTKRSIARVCGQADAVNTLRRGSFFVLEILGFSAAGLLVPMAQACFRSLGVFLQENGLAKVIRTANNQHHRIRPSGIKRVFHRHPELDTLLYQRAITCFEKTAFWRLD
jgi:hypothetical protein